MAEKYRKKKLFKVKDWTELSAQSSWRMFKIMAEFVDGFETMDKIGPCVSIYGSARTKPDHKYYKLSEQIAAKLVHEGFGIITGGGPGIMEAGNSYGTYRGRFYLVYAANSPAGDGNKPNIYCRYSTDQGLTFSSPILVNDNDAGVSADGKMKIVLEYTEDDFRAVKEALLKVAKTPEQAVWQLLDLQA